MPPEPKPTILMLDDEKFLLAIYKLTLEKHGFDVTTYYDADDALKALREGFEPDVLLFDITMPDGRSGYEFIETVHKEKLARRSLKVALTNEGQEGERARMGELGTEAYLQKASFIPSEIAAKVREMLAMKQK